MALAIKLDNNFPHYTNLDLISGRIILDLSSDESISSIQVKLEGEARTRLAEPDTTQRLYSGAYDQQARAGVMTELHKILYNVQTVFPTRELAQRVNAGSTLTLPPGHHEYPFQFKLPINNHCQPITGLQSFMGSQPVREMHVRQTLPPSMNNFPGEAEIRYYIKATVVRPKFYQENRRTQKAFNFLPVEPPRQPPSLQEKFARRNHEFAAIPKAPEQRSNNPFWAANPRKSTDSPQVDPPKFSVEARLPNPAVLTRGQPVPLRMIVTKLSQSFQKVYMVSLQLQLKGYTEIKAQHLIHKETQSWTLVTLANLTLPMGKPEDRTGTETILDSATWDEFRVPDATHPSFKTCNIKRSYEFEVTAGFRFGDVNQLSSEIAILPLRLPVEVFSGVPPPAALLEAVRTGRPLNTSSPNSRPNLNTTFASSAAHPFASHPFIPPTPISGPSNSGQAPQDFFADSSARPVPGQVQAQSNGAPPTFEADAPPSYNEAMAENSGSVEGDRGRAFNGMEPGSSRVDGSGAMRVEERTGGFRQSQQGGAGRGGVPADFSGQ